MHMFSMSYWSKKIIGIEQWFHRNLCLCIALLKQHLSCTFCPKPVLVHHQTRNLWMPLSAAVFGTKILVRFSGHTGKSTPREMPFGTNQAGYDGWAISSCSVSVWSIQHGSFLWWIIPRVWEKEFLILDVFEWYNILPTRYRGTSWKFWGQLDMLIAAILYESHRARGAIEFPS